MMRLRMSLVGYCVLDAKIETQFLDLIASLDQFSKQQAISSGLNIFEAAGLSRQEFRHSNFLEFLLNPRAPHGLGDAFLKQLLRRALDYVSSSPPIGALDLALADFSNALVRREWRGIDLLVESKANRLVVAIENKIDAAESKGQLDKYQKTVEAEYRDERKLCCFLTPEGDPPSSEAWSVLTYSDVVQALIEASSNKSTILTPEAKILIEHYVQLLRRSIVSDQELIDACRRIYSQHKAALDLIIRFGEVNTFDTASQAFLAAHPEVEKIYTRSGRAVAFLPPEFLKILPEMKGVNWFGQSRPFMFWFNRYAHRIGLVFEVGPFAGERFERRELAQALLDHFGNTSQIAPKYTRVFSEYRKLSEDQASDDETLHKIMEELFSSSQRHFAPVQKILSEFFKSK